MRDRKEDIRMVDTDRLRGLIAERGLSQRQVAAKMAVSESTFYAKMKTGKFNADEMYYLIKLLGIEDPASIFFTN